jgi:hypothetical protein
MLSVVEEQADEVALPSIPAEDDEPEDGIAPELADDYDLQSTAHWDDAAIQQLGWERFNVTDPEVFSDVDAAFEEGDYDQAQTLIDDWEEKNPAQLGKENMFDRPNAPKKKRCNQTRAGRESDYDDIASDSSSITFDAGAQIDMMNARLETEND